MVYLVTRNKKKFFNFSLLVVDCSGQMDGSTHSEQILC